MTGDWVALYQYVLTEVHDVSAIGLDYLRGHVYLGLTYAGYDAHVNARMEIAYTTNGSGGPALVGVAGHAAGSRQLNGAQRVSDNRSADQRASLLGAVLRDGHVSGHQRRARMIAKTTVSAHGNANDATRGVATTRRGTSLATRVSDALRTFNRDRGSVEQSTFAQLVVTRCLTTGLRGCAFGFWALVFIRGGSFTGL